MLAQTQKHTAAVFRGSNWTQFIYFMSQCIWFITVEPMFFVTHGCLICVIKSLCEKGVLPFVLMAWSRKAASPAGLN